MGAFIAALGASPVHLLGHSRGGYVAFAVARRWPHLLRSLILVDPNAQLEPNLVGSGAAGDGGQGLFRDCAALVQAGDVDDALQRFFGVISPGGWGKLPEIAKNVMRENAATLIGQATERREPFSAAAMREIAVPTLLLNGGESPAFFHLIADAMLRHIKDVRQVVIEGGGHTMNIQQPSAFNAAVPEFLAAH